MAEQQLDRTDIASLSIDQSSFGSAQRVSTVGRGGEADRGNPLIDEPIWSVRDVGSDIRRPQSKCAARCTRRSLCSGAFACGRWIRDVHTVPTRTRRQERYWVRFLKSETVKFLVACARMSYRTARGRQNVALAALTSARCHRRRASAVRSPLRLHLRTKEPLHQGGAYYRLPDFRSDAANFSDPVRPKTQIGNAYSSAPDRRVASARQS